MLNLTEKDLRVLDSALCVATSVYRTDGNVSDMRECLRVWGKVVAELHGKDAGKRHNAIHAGEM